MFVKYLIGFLSTLSLFQQHVVGYRRFFNGRPYKGSVGEPSIEFAAYKEIDPDVGLDASASGPNKHATRKVIKIKEHWLYQQVDNFDPNNQNTWANVCFILTDMHTYSCNANLIKSVYRIYTAILCQG